jgi:hypothetical protein
MLGSSAPVTSFRCTALPAHTLRIHLHHRLGARWDVPEHCEWYVPKFPFLAQVHRFALYETEQVNRELEMYSNEEIGTSLVIYLLHVFYVYLRP